MASPCVLQVTNGNKLQFLPYRGEADEVFANFNANVSPNQDPLGQIEILKVFHSQVLTANQLDQLIANVRSLDSNQREVFKCFHKRPRGFVRLKRNFFNCYLPAPWPTSGHSQGGSLTNPMLITTLYLFRPEGHRDLRNEVGSLSPAKRLVGYELGNFRF